MGSSSWRRFPGLGLLSVGIDPLVPLHSAPPTFELIHTVLRGEGLDSDYVYATFALLSVAFSSCY